MTTTVAHHDPIRPAYGYVAEPRDFFDRARAAKLEADRRRGWQAEFLADDLVVGVEITDFTLDRYRRTVAAKAYADAVYEVEAAPIRARAKARR